MASSSCRLGLFILLLFVYICDSKVRLNNDAKVDYTSRSKDTHENQDLFQKSKIRGKVVQDKGHEIKLPKKGHKKQVIDAVHLGPYHHGHSWGTTSVWPGIAGWGHTWGYPVHHGGWMGYPSLSSYKSQVPGREKNDKVHSRASINNSRAIKRWWPGYMGGWGNWGWGNTGYPGWGGLGFGGNHGLGWGHPLLRSGIPGKRNKASKRWWPGYMGGWGGWGWGNTGYPGWGWGGWGHGHGWGHGQGWGHELGHGAWFRSQLPSSSNAPKRQFIDEPFDDFHDSFGDFHDSFGDYQDYPWEAPFPEYGPLNYFGGWGYPGFGWGDMPFNHFADNAYYKSSIPKHGHKPNEKEESGMTRQFVHGFHPGSYGWGGVTYPGFGWAGTLPLMGAHMGYPFTGPFYRSEIPNGIEEKADSRQVINYHPGCYGWGGCVYPGCGYLGGFAWPCHHGCCGSCCCRSKTPMGQGSRSEKGRSRQEITSPEEDEGEERKQMFSNPMEQGMNDVEKLAIGFPGEESFHTPLGSNIDPNAGPVASQLGISNQLPFSAMGEPNGMEEITQPEVMPGLPTTQEDSIQKFKAEMASEDEQQSDEPENNDLMTNFNMSPEGDTGIPITTGASAESASRRGVIPEVKETVTKKQAVTYPYSYPSTMPSYYMTHGVSPYTAMVPHEVGYPTFYPSEGQPTGPYANPLHPSHSIHVGAPNVNVDVQTTREHVAQRPEEERGHKLALFVSEAVKKLKKAKVDGKENKMVRKRQLSPLLSQASSGPISTRFPFPIAAVLPFSISGLPQSMFTQSGHSTEAFSPSTTLDSTTGQHAFSRQLSSTTGIDAPLASQPGMGILGNRKKRSASKSKKHRQSQKRQFLVGPATRPVFPAFPLTTFHAPVALAPWHVPASVIPAPGFPATPRFLAPPVFPATATFRTPGFPTPPGFPATPRFLAPPLPGFPTPLMLPFRGPSAAIPTFGKTYPASLVRNAVPAFPVVSSLPAAGISPAMPFNTAVQSTLPFPTVGTFEPPSPVSPSTSAEESGLGEMRKGVSPPAAVLSEDQPIGFSQELSVGGMQPNEDEPASYAKPEGPDGLTLHSDGSPPTILGEGRAMLEEPSSMEPAHMGEVADRRGSLFTRIQARRNKQA